MQPGFSIFAQGGEKKKCLILLFSYPHFDTNQYSRFQAPIGHECIGKNRNESYVVIFATALCKRDFLRAALFG